MAFPTHTHLRFSFETAVVCPSVVWSDCLKIIFILFYSSFDYSKRWLLKVQIEVAKSLMCYLMWMMALSLHIN